MSQPMIVTPDLRPDPHTLDRGALAWRTSSFSSGHGGNCVEVAAVPGGGWAMRNSKDPDGPLVTFSTSEFDDFCAGVEAGEFRR
jgi:hypothetical protein